MSRTFEEKLEYNRRRQAFGSNFASGYVFGATIYTDYPKSDAETREVIKSLIDSAKDLASESELHRGIMCGYRDAANARKGRTS